MGGEPGIDLFVELCWFTGSPGAFGKLRNAKQSSLRNVLPCWNGRFRNGKRYAATLVRSAGLGGVLRLVY